MLDGVVNNMTEEEEKLRKIKKIQDAIATPPSTSTTINYQKLGYKLGYKLLDNISDTHNKDK